MNILKVFSIFRCKQLSEIVKVSTIAVNENSNLFVTENGQLWVSGDHPQIDINSEEPKKVIFFDGYIVLNVICGSNFYVVLVKKIQKLIEDDESDIDEIYVKSCSQCLNHAMPNSPQNSPSIISNEISPNKSKKSSKNSSPKKDNIFYEEKNKNQVNNNNTNGETNETEALDTETKVFSNAESAKLFLTRQLSWVSSYGSAKEEFQIETIENRPNLIKQNVSNMANFVYEGVKTVGDKVAILSRHVSGSSDVHDIHNDSSENFEDLGLDELKKAGGSLINSVRTEDFPWSTSTGSSENELVLQRLNEKINLLVKVGFTSLNTELWTWGEVQYGQLGVGDMMSRPRPREVTMLSHCGIKKVVCGDNHTLALTLDGRVFIWGRNHFMQVAQCSQIDQKSPQLFSTNFFLHFSPEERVKDIAAGDDYSLVMMDQKIFLMGKQG